MSSLIYLLDNVIKNKGRKLRKSGEWIYYCPFCSHYKPKLQINIKSQKYHCWVCSEKGITFTSLFYKLNATSQQFEELSELGLLANTAKFIVEKENDFVKLPPEFKSLINHGDSIIYKHAISYLKQRNIIIDDIMKYNIGYCNSGIYNNRIIIPSYDEVGKLNFFIGRDMYSSYMKYRNSPTPKDIIGFDFFVNWNEDIILVEGVFDAIAIKRNVIPLFGKTILPKLKQKIYKKQVKSIFIVLDRDATLDSIRMIDEFMKNGINVYFVRLTGKDPSELGFNKMLKLIRETNQTTFSDLIKLKLNGSTTAQYLEIL